MSVCYDGSGIPVPCAGWTVYNSYVTDPRYQRYLTIAWTCTLAALFLLTVPSIFRFVLRQFHQEKWHSLFGVYEDNAVGGYAQLNETSHRRPMPAARSRTNLFKIRKPFLTVSALVNSISRHTVRIPFSGYSTTLCLGQLFWLLLIPAFIFATLFPESQLAENPNRFGFLALACIPPLFVLSSKNGAVSLLLGRSWVAVNFLHRWLGRAVLLLVVCHFGLWTAQWARAGQLSEFFSSSKELRGIGAFAFLLLITVSSLPSIRRFSYPIFFTLHYVSILGFLVFLNQHTIYARGWATWSVVGIYAVDIAGRIASLRIRWVEVEALPGGMTRVAMRGVTGGWIGGQTIDLRLFFVPTPPNYSGGGSHIGTKLKETLLYSYRSVKAAIRPFESHPFSIASASPTSLGENPDRGIELYIRSVGEGTWTDDLHRFALSSGSEPANASDQTGSQSSTSQESQGKTTPVLALFFGPYAPSSFSTYSASSVFEDRETVSLFAGGSGMSFVIGVLEEIVARRLHTGRSGQIEIVWVVQDYTHTSWFLARLDRMISSIPPASALSISLQLHITHPNTNPPQIPLSPAIHLFSNEGGRPDLPSILTDQISRTLSPCAHCYPVCKCGQRAENADDSETGRTGGEGCCPNREEECVGGCGNANELLFDTRGPVRDYDPSHHGLVKEEDDDDDEIQESPSRNVPTDRETKCQCSRDKGEKDEGGCRSNLEREAQRGCCGSQSRSPSLARVSEVPTPLRARAGRGMSVFVCGPRAMTSDLRNAVASVPLAKQVKLGGIHLYVENYTI